MSATLEAILICVEEEQEMMHVLANDGVNECTNGGPGRKRVRVVMKRTTGSRIKLLQGQGIDAGAIVRAAFQSLAGKHELHACASRQQC